MYAMRKQIAFFLLVTSGIYFGGCRGYSKYTIDEKPQLIIDTSLLGIWKAIEDTDKADYILVQTSHDVFHRTVTKYPEYSRSDAPFMDYKENKNQYYFITRMDHHGINPHYQQWNAFTSYVNNATFLNIKYVYSPSAYLTPGSPVNTDGDEEGYLLVRVLNINPTKNRITTATVADTFMKHIKSSKEVRAYVEKNLDNPAFYSDTFHFYKVSNYHESLNESINRANK